MSDIDNEGQIVHSDNVSVRSDTSQRKRGRRKSELTRLQERISAQEERFSTFEEKMDRLLNFMGNKGRDVSPEKPPTPGRDEDFIEGTSGAPRTQDQNNNAVHGEFDNISVIISQSERRNANFSIIDSRNSASKSEGSRDENQDEVGRFGKYTNKHSSQKEVNNKLGDIFGSDAQTIKENADIGLTLDESQQQILSNSWHNSTPMKMSSYRDSYRASFPINENCKESLLVPTLDDTIESLLVKKYGHKAAFGSSRGLYNRQMRTIEKIGYQGQTAARMGIITTCYTQQALGCLLDNLQSREPNLDKAVQTVRDVFAMTTKTLDQFGRTGAYHHLARRKAAIYDTGLDEYKDYSNTIMSLPLSSEGVFGSQFDEKLKSRQERFKQISEVLPELDSHRGSKSISGVGNKRKAPSSFAYSSSQPKRSKTGTDRSRSYSYSYNSNYGRSNWSRGRPSSRGKSATVSSFRTNTKDSQ